MNWFHPEFYHGQSVEVLLPDSRERIPATIWAVHPAVIEVIVGTPVGYTEIRLVPAERVFPSTPTGRQHRYVRR